MTQNLILFLRAMFGLDGKVFGEDDSFVDSAETPSRIDFCAMMYYVNFVRGSLSEMLSKFVELLWGPFFIVI